MSERQTPGPEEAAPLRRCLLALQRLVSPQRAIAIALVVVIVVALVDMVR